jgi:hypothetical protein
MPRALVHRGGGSAVRTGRQPLVASSGRRELALFAIIYLLYDSARWGSTRTCAPRAPTRTGSSTWSARCTWLSKANRSARWTQV